MNYDFGGEEFKSQLKQKSNEIGERLSNTIIDSPNFLLLRNLLKAASDNYRVNDYHCLTISETDFLRLPEDMDEKVAALFKEPVFIKHYHVEIGQDFSILSNDDSVPSHNNNEVRRYYTELSKNRIVIFLFTSGQDVNYFVGGIDGGNNIFYTKEEADSYIKKKKANELENVLEDYRVHLRQRDTYEKFFITKSMLNILYESLKIAKKNEKSFKKENGYLLFNKPESRFRDDLYFYLKSEMQAIINREDFQDDENRLDISVMDNFGTGIYLLEIKWIGKSISADDKGFGTEFSPTPHKVAEWVNQTVGYIKQKSDEHANIKNGYLVVFDARLNDITTDYDQMISVNVLEEDLKPFFYRFKKINDFRVKNTTPR